MVITFWLNIVSDTFHKKNVILLWNKTYAIYKHIKMRLLFELYSKDEDWRINVHSFTAQFFYNMSYLGSQVTTEKR